MSPLQGRLGGWHLEAVFCLQGTVHRASLSGLTTPRTQESDLAFLWPEGVCLYIQCLLASKPLWLLRAFRSGMNCPQLPLKGSPLLCAQQVIQHFFPWTLCVPDIPAKPVYSWSPPWTFLALFLTSLLHGVAGPCPFFLSESHWLFQVQGTPLYLRLLSQTPWPEGLPYLLSPVSRSWVWVKGSIHGWIVKGMGSDPATYQSPDP